MTMISGMCLHGYPMLIGDFLVWGQREAAPSVDLPTGGTTQGVSSQYSNGAPVGFAPKLYSITETLAVACAGNALYARTFVGRLRRNPPEEPTLDALSAKIEEIYRNEAAYRKLSTIFAGISPKEGTSRIDSFLAATNCSESGNEPPWFEWYASGSGSEDIAALWREFNPPATPEAEGHRESIRRALVATGAVLLRLAADNSALANMWGGAAEVIALTPENTLRKVGGVLHIIEVLTPPAPGRFRTARILKLNYNDDQTILAMRSFAHDPGETGEVGERTPIVLGEFGDPVSGTFDLGSFDAEWVVHTRAGPTGPGRAAYSTIAWHDDQRRAAYFEREGRGARLVYGDEFRSAIETGTEDLLRRLSDAGYV